MYKIEYLPLALEDLLEITKYISNTLKNSKSAQKLYKKIIGAIDNLEEFPNSNPMFISQKKLKYEYRKLTVDNYIVFYCIDDIKKLVTIVRVIYKRRNHENLL